MKKLFLFTSACFALLTTACNGGGGGGEEKKTLESISASLLEEKYYYVGDTINKTDIKVTAEYSDKTSTEVSSDKWNSTLFGSNESYTFTADDVSLDPRDVEITYENKSATFQMYVFDEVGIKAFGPKDEFLSGSQIKNTDFEVYFTLNGEVTTSKVPESYIEIEELDESKTYTFTKEDGKNKSKTFHIDTFGLKAEVNVKVYNEYSLSIGEHENCEVYLDVTQARGGDVITVYAIPSLGYRLETLTINGKEQTGAFKDGYSYRFEMPEEDVKVVVTTTVATIYLDAYFYDLTYGEKLVTGVQLKAYSTKENDEFTFTSSNSKIAKVGESDGIVTPVGNSNDLVVINVKSKTTNDETNCFIRIKENIDYEFSFSKDSNDEIHLNKFDGNKSSTKIIAFVPSHVKLENDTEFRNVTVFDNESFYCANISYIKLPITLKSFKGHTFEFCDKLKFLYLPESFEKFDNSSSNGVGYTFMECKNLEAIYVDPDNSNFTDIRNNEHEGILYSKDFKELLFYPPQIKQEEYDVPDETEKIYCFNVSACTQSTDNTGNVYIKKITYGKNVKKISGFNNCKALEEVTCDEPAESAITGFAMDAFYGCTSLKSFTFGAQLKNVGDFMFENCTSLSEIKYLGTIETWKTVGYRGTGRWHKNCPVKVVICSDGECGLDDK